MLWRTEMNDAFHYLIFKNDVLPVWLNVNSFCVQDSERAGWYYTGPSAKLQVGFILCFKVCPLAYSLGTHWSHYFSPDTYCSKTKPRIQSTHLNPAIWLTEWDHSFGAYSNLCCHSKVNIILLLQFYIETAVNVDRTLIPDLFSEVSIKVDTEPLY